MAKIKRGLIKLSGKLGDEVHINGANYAPHVRKTPESKIKRTRTEIKEQYTRTGFMNQLASELNQIIGAYSDNFKTKDFYHRILARFRNKPTDSRFLELYKLKGLEIHESYPFGRLGQSSAVVEKAKNKIIVSLNAPSHPKASGSGADSYCFEVLLITWSANKEKPIHKQQYSEWIKLKGEEKEFEFLFALPAAASHWLLCLRKRLGIYEEAIGTFATDGMQVYDVGTFDPAEADLLEKKIAKENEEERLRKINSRKIVKEVVRVKAKR